MGERKALTGNQENSKAGWLQGGEEGTVPHLQPIHNQSTRREPEL